MMTASVANTVSSRDVLGRISPTVSFGDQVLSRALECGCVLLWYAPLSRKLVVCAWFWHGEAAVAAESALAVESGKSMALD